MKLINFFCFSDFICDTDAVFEVVVFTFVVRHHGVSVIEVVSLCQKRNSVKLNFKLLMIQEQINQNDTEEYVFIVFRTCKQDLDTFNVI